MSHLIPQKTTAQTVVSPYLKKVFPSGKVLQNPHDIIRASNRKETEP